jgi:hypothetical protein
MFLSSFLHWGRCILITAHLTLLKGWVYLFFVGWWYGQKIGVYKL